MKSYKFSLLFVMLLSVIVGCQKEMSVEQPILNPAAGSLKSNQTGDCNPISVKGTYKSGTNVGDTNYVEVQVNVTKLGSYTIVTDTTNGYSFKGTGNFTSLGLATVRLQASGKPVVPQVDDFTVMFDTSFCFFEVTVIQGTSSGTPATFSLQGAPNACGNFAPNGNYVVNTALNSTNTVTVGVNVTQVGSYNITTNTVNGYSFAGSGAFTATGLQTVVLNGTGTPTAAGANSFTVTAGTSTCTFPITVTSTPPANATFSFAGAPNACGNFTSQGTYTANTPLGATNTVTVGVNVTAIGAYNITTNAVNGMTFSKTGSFTNTGAQTVVLNGTGTPTTAGAANFTVSSGTIPTCSFSITVGGTTTPTNTDYFPTSTNSNWSYEFDDNPTDTVLRKVIPQTHSALGNTYKIFMFTDDASSGFDSSGYYRKSGGDYYEYFNAADFYGFDNDIWTEYIILKDNQPVNTVWTSPSFTGSVQGTSFTLREKMKILQKDVTVSVNNVSYPNTIVVEQRTEQNVAGTWQDMTQVFGLIKAYYAKGVGLIKYEFVDSNGTVTDKIEITRHVVF